MAVRHRKIVNSVLGDVMAIVRFSVLVSNATSVFSLLYSLSLEMSFCLCCICQKHTEIKNVRRRTRNVWFRESFSSLEWSSNCHKIVSNKFLAAEQELIWIFDYNSILLRFWFFFHSDHRNDVKLAKQTESRNRHEKNGSQLGSAGGTESLPLMLHNLFGSMSLGIGQK